MVNGVWRLYRANDGRSLFRTLFWIALPTAFLLGLLSASVLTLCSHELKRLRTSCAHVPQPG